MLSALYENGDISIVDTVLLGWLELKLSDRELETRGLALYEGLYEALSRQAQSVKKGA